MTSTSSPFPLLRLPYLALEEILRSFYCGDLIEISACSKRFKRIVKSIKNEFTGIQIKIRSHYFTLLVVGKDGIESAWRTLGIGSAVNARYLVLGGTNIQIKRYGDYFGVYWPPQTRLLILTSLVDHIVDSLQIPITSVQFITDGFEDIFDFVPHLQKSRNIWFDGSKPMSAGDRDFVRNNVSSDTELHFYPPIKE